MHKTPCGSFWIYDLDDVEDGADGVSSLTDYANALYRVNEDVEQLPEPEMHFHKKRLVSPVVTLR